jgi:hypothetical protein
MWLLACICIAALAGLLFGFDTALISGLFPSVAAWSKGAPLVFFAAMMALHFIVVLRCYPETKRIALEDLSV